MKLEQTRGVRQQLTLSEIRLDGGTQPRSVLDVETIEDYAELMKSGTHFPAVVVFYDGQSYWLADGFHRVKAAGQIQAASIDAEIIQGTLEEARWYSFGVNQSHGLRRANEDKQRAVKAALEHATAQALSDSAIAKHVGVDHVTVGRWRGKLAPSCEVHKMARTVTRGGTTYQQDVTNIGRQRRHQPRKAVTTVPQLSRKQVRKAATSKGFEKQIARLVKVYERRRPKIATIRVIRNASSIGIEIEEQGSLCAT